MTFRDHVQTIVDDFLHTVVVVDDRILDPVAGASDARKLAIESKDGSESVHGHRGVSSNLVDPASPDQSKENDAKLDDDLGAEHNLDAKKVSDSFARHGLVCGLLSPGPGENITDTFVAAARRADLLVLDWVLDRDNGKKAMKLIRAVIDADAGQRKHRLRAIAIYTGQTDLDDILVQLRESLVDVFPHDQIVEDGLAFRKGPVRVAVFAKADTDLPAEFESRRVLIDDLPTRLKTEFSELVDGIIPAVALGALGALRDDAHRVLNVLSPTLDAAFIGHRCAIDAPSDAADQAIALVASEIRSVIEEHDLGRLIDHGVVRKWIERQQTNGFAPGGLIEGVPPIPAAMLDRIIEEGARGAENASEALGYSKKNIRTIGRAGARLFASDDAQAQESERRFASAMWFRTMYTNPKRMLGLGTLVEAPSGAALLCLQPLCDSVRLEGPTSFVFLELVRTDSSTYQVTLDSPDGTALYAAVKPKIERIRTIVFAPAIGAKRVEAADADGRHRFTAVDGSTYEWLATMKPEFAQKVATDVASELSRVAVDEPEARRTAAHTEFAPPTTPAANVVAPD